MKLELNANQRLDPYLVRNLDFDKNKLSVRIFNATIPFLNFYRPTQVGLTASLGMARCYKIITSQEKKSKKIYKVAFAVFQVSLSIIAPTMTAGASHGLNIIEKIYLISRDLLKDQQRADMREGFFQGVVSILNSAIYISSLYFAAPIVIAVSLVSQALFEMYRGYKEYKAGRYLESGANLLLASIRLYQAQPIIKKYYQEYQKEKPLEKGIHGEFKIQFEAQITDIINQNNEFKTIRLKKPTSWKFMPGQYLEITLAGSQAKKPAILAIASGINDDYIEITAKPNSNPEHSNYCLNALVGDHLIVSAPLGSYYPIDLISPKTPVYILGGGSGLTALKSLMESLPQNADKKLIYSAKTYEELIYKNEIEEWKEQGSIISLTQQKKEGFEEGRITQYLVFDAIDPNAFFFLCGSKQMVLDTAKLLIDSGVSKESIYGSLPVLASENGPVFRADHPKMQLLS